MLNSMKFSIEQLEKREMMAGDVGVSVLNGDLRIVGNAADNQVEVYRLNNGQIRVAGIDTTVNGSSSQNFSVSDDIFITMNQGNNDVFFRNYNGGVRADAVQISMSNGKDRVFVDGLRARGDVEIHTWGGNDQISISRSSAGTQPIFDRENVLVRSGAGDDTIDLFQVVAWGDIDIETFDSANAVEADVVRIDRALAGDDLFIDLGGGNDDAVVRNTDVWDDLSLTAGGGIDFADFQGNDVGDRLSANMGAGNDDLWVRQTEARRASLRGGTGNSDYVYYAQNDIDSTFITEFEDRDIF